MDYAKYEEKRTKYSEDIYFLNYDTEFELWLDGEKTNSFETLRDVNKFLFKTYMLCRPARRVYVYTIFFNEIYNYYCNLNCCFTVINKKKNVEPKAFRVFGGITYKDAKYYLGTDKTDGIKPSNYCELISTFHNKNIKHNFTSSLRETVFISELEEFGNPVNLPATLLNEMYETASLAPIIYSEINKEFEDVYCYDFDSAYIAQYFQCRFPYKFTFTGNNLVQGSENFVRVRFKNIRAKNPRFLSLSVASRGNGKNIIFISKNSKRILMADEVVVSFFYNLDMEIIKQDYEFEEMIIEKCWQVEMRPLPKEFRDRVIEFYQTKEEAKRRGTPYADKKVLLNRIHGFFLTKKEINTKEVQMYKNMPAQIGFYTVARQRRIMRNLIQEIGLENIVSAHTDSIKTKGNYDAIVKKYNDTHKTKYSDSLGVLQSEGIMEKVVYFSNTRAKYIMNGEFHIKHGGIDEHTAENIINTYSYETLQSTSPYDHTIEKSFIRNGEINVLYRNTEKRFFSEEGGIFND